jgi:hypothetical protein
LVYSPRRDNNFFSRGDGMNLATVFELNAGSDGFIPLLGSDDLVDVGLGKNLRFGRSRLGITYAYGRRSLR